MNKYETKIMQGENDEKKITGGFELEQD